MSRLSGTKNMYVQARVLRPRVLGSAGSGAANWLEVGHVPDRRAAVLGSARGREEVWYVTSFFVPDCCGSPSVRIFWKFVNHGSQLSLPGTRLPNSMFALGRS